MLEGNGDDDRSLNLDGGGEIVITPSSTVDAVDALKLKKETQPPLVSNASELIGRAD